MTRRYTAHCRVEYEDRTGLEKFFIVAKILDAEDNLTPDEILERLTDLKEGVDSGKYKSFIIQSLGPNPHTDLLSAFPHYP